MRDAGWFLILLGLCAVFGSLLIDVTVNVGYVPYSPYAPSMPSSVANLHAMHIQGLVFQGGLFAFLSGTVCAVGASIVDAIRRAGVLGSPESVATPEADSAIAPASGFSEQTYAGSSEDPQKSLTMVLGALFLVAIVVVTVVVLTGNHQGGYSSSAANDAAANAANAMNAATDAMNAAASDAQNAAEQVTREVEAAAREATRAR